MGSASERQEHACQKPVTRGNGKAATAAMSERSEGGHAVEATREWQTASGKKGKKKGKGNGNNTSGTSDDEQLARRSMGRPQKRIQGGNRITGKRRGIAHQLMPGKRRARHICRSPSSFHRCSSHKCSRRSCRGHSRGHSTSSRVPRLLCKGSRFRKQV